MTSNLSPVSSLKDEEKVIYVQPHYKESYRLAIYALLSGGREAYEEFIQAEQIGHLLSEDEILFILDNAELAALEDGDEAEVRRPAVDDLRASTYFPSESDEEVPELDMGWPEVVPEEGADTSISLLFHPPRQGMPTIKEVIRKQIQEARQVIAIAMDVFTDVDIFKEVIGVTMRGVVVYILLDDSQVGSFLTMSRRVGINILDFQSIRVRTVQGQQYQCQSGAKFHGGLEQKFILVDCQTVLYGTYSYTWAYEKINTSMVLVVTGQLACSYDEEFRRLYARSIVPVAMCRENLANHYMADSFGYNSDYASQLSLHQVHMKPTVMHGMRSAQDSWYNNAPVLTRGFSVQDRLHQIHSSDVGNLVRGHSYAGDLHKLHPTSRLRMGTKDPQVKTLRGDPRAQKQQLHQSRYGLDQNLIPFNSESSLNRWKIDTYLNESVMHLDRGFDVTSPIASPFSSQTGLNEQVHSRSRDIKSRMEEMRQRRLSLQDFNNLRQSQESLRSMYNPLERSVLMSSNRSLDMRQSLTDLQTNVQNGYNVDSAHQKVSESNKDGSKRETMQMYNRHEPHAAGSSVMKQNDPSLKHSHLHPSNLSSHLSRAMESLTEVPEEKEGSNSRINSLDSEATHHSGVKKPHREEPAAPKESSNLPADSQQQNQTRGSQVSVNSSESAASEGREKSVSNAAENTPKVINASAAEVKGGPSEKQREEPILQRKNSMKMKMQAFLSSDEKKASKKEDKDKSLQRKPSLRSQNSSGLTQPLGADQSTPAPAAEPPKSQNPELSGSVESEKHKSPLLRLSPLRSSKKKTAAEQDQGAKTAVETPAAPPRRKVYSRFEYLLSNENISMDTEKDRGASSSIQQTPSSNDNKLGRLMQRVVGNLRSKMS